MRFGSYQLEFFSLLIKAAGCMTFCAPLGKLSPLFTKHRPSVARLRKPVFGPNCRIPVDMEEEAKKAVGAGNYLLQMGQRAERGVALFGATANKYLRRKGGVLVLKLEVALLYIDIE